MQEAVSPLTFGSGILFVFIALMLWTVVWKGIALWKAARLSQKWWFVALLIINTLGILEIIYIYFVARRREEQAETADDTSQSAT